MHTDIKMKNFDLDLFHYAMCWAAYVYLFFKIKDIETIVKK